MFPREILRKLNVSIKRYINIHRAHTKFPSYTKENRKGISEEKGEGEMARINRFGSYAHLEKGSF